MAFQRFSEHVIGVRGFIRLSPAVVRSATWEVHRVVCCENAGDLQVFDAWVMPFLVTLANCRETFKTYYLHN